MPKFMQKAMLGVTLAATALTAAAPADAQRWRRYHRDRGGDVATGAIIGGIVGLGIGAAIASNNRRDRYYDGYYDRGYYPRNNYYRDPYFQPRYRNYYRGYAPRCYTVRQFDPWGRRIRTRVCD
jgi:hypothetical protein